MERIEPIRRREDSPWVAPAAPGRRVDRREPDDDSERKRRQQQGQRDETSDGRPDADGHIDVSV